MRKLKKQKLKEHKEVKAKNEFLKSLKLEVVEEEKQSN